ncbi:MULTISPECIES: DUF7260 family protein [Halorussus]|uniref:DUF7260 family protein n=1 Tax=Halorussus TaxID=1070314 RepID=UPI00209E7DFB|nr:hypothetical protein [Halorussus vallis]USZ76168.1 hypothetical protein NGM07_02305 [Halorussus vallis]
MSVELRTQAAMERCETEREETEAKAAAFEAFAERVADAPVESGGAGSGGALSGGTPSGGGPAAGALSVHATGTSSNGVDVVRSAFRETVLPHADADGVTAAMADELSTDLAAAFSPAANGLPRESKRTLLERVDERRSECRLLVAAVDAERERLDEFAAELDAVTGWLAEADETSLLRLGFEDLRARHDRLASFRETCDELARERQAELRGTRNSGLKGIRKRELVDALYGNFPDDHPVLADLARLADLLADCQRAVRRHLCARA